MNLFQCVYCNQYKELKEKGRDAGKARTNGIIINAVVLVLNIFSLMLVMVTYASHSRIGGMINRVFHNFGTGRAAGQSLGAIVFVFAATAIYYTIGTESYFNNTVTLFEKLSAEKQKSISSKGAAFLFGSIGIFFLLMATTFFFK